MNDPIAPDASADPAGRGPAAPPEPTAQGLAALLDVSLGVAESLDLKTVLQASVDGVERLAGLGTSAVYLLGGEHLRLWATTPPMPPDFPEEFRVAPLADHPHIRRALVENAPVLLTDRSAVELTPAEAEVMRARDLRTVLFLPLVAGSNRLGVLIVGSVAAPRAISEADVRLCRTLANLAALAVANAQLFESVEHQAEELRRTLAERQSAEEARERLQSQFLEAQKMESVGRLAGGVAHDFNNMLQVILSHTELAADPEADARDVADALREIRRAAERSASLTGQLLAFARRQTAEPRVIDLNETVGRMLSMLRPLLGEDISLVWRPGSNVGAVLMDPTQVEQILANLCVNARDAIQGTGKLSVETRVAVLDEDECLRYEALDPGEYCVLEVSDTGSGMNAQTLAHVFEPFFTTKPTGKGTGLGLATVYGIVRQNRGAVSVTSEPGAGTSFRVMIPRHAAAGRPAGPAEAPPTERGRAKGTVLVVEDEPAILRLTATSLARKGYAVLSAAEPMEAIRLAGGHPGVIDLLVTDVVMPGLNGRDLWERLRSSRPDMRCLFMSGYPSEVVGREAILDPGMDFLAKPFTLAELDAKVRDVLGRPG